MIAPPPKINTTKTNISLENIIWNSSLNFLILNSTSTHNIKSIFKMHIYFIAFNFTSTYNRNEKFCDQVSWQAVFYQFQMFNVIGKERCRDEVWEWKNGIQYEVLQMKRNCLMTPSTNALKVAVLISEYSMIRIKIPIILLYSIGIYGITSYKNFRRLSEYLTKIFVV